MTPKCRFCQSDLEHTFADLGVSPLSNSYLDEDQLHKMEPFYPLHARVCKNCLLVQIEDFETPENIFSDYAYFSSYSDSWLKHAERYANSMTEMLSLNNKSKVIEIASNDGYLLQFFKQAGIPVLGIEPAANVASSATEQGIETICEFFGTVLSEKLTGKGIRADLLIGNNVLAHVPDINDFIAGMRMILSPYGVITMEFPHLLKMIEHSQFDTIYHEHFSYLSMSTVKTMFDHHGLHVFKVQSLPTHGGSLRIFAQHANSGKHADDGSVGMVIQEEMTHGLHDPDSYADFERRIHKARNSLMRFLVKANEEGLHVAGYGAPAKGNTLLNYCGIRKDLVQYTVDRNPHKQGKYLPGSHLPIHAPEMLKQTRPDYVLILPWNIKEEIIDQIGWVRDWGGRFVIAIPEVDILQ